VERNGPAVVNISITAKLHSTGNNSAVPDLDPNDPFSQFFRRFGVPQQAPRDRVVQGQGSASSYARTA